jgi:dipeptidyl aminopeptidase/acylaminoacyl peptidase
MKLSGEAVGSMAVLPRSKPRSRPTSPAASPLRLSSLRLLALEDWWRIVPVREAGQNLDFEKWSPHKHAAKFKTPNLIIHNELDFRVPAAQGIDLFTVLQRRGIPSKFLYFPDEGHWVLKPQNSALWHETIFQWLAAYLK